MKLDRNINGTGRGKYGLVNNRKLAEVDEGGPSQPDPIAVRDAIAVLEHAGILDWGTEGTASEFFVIKLRDECSQDALYAYANEASRLVGKEYAEEVIHLAMRAGPNSPFRKKPD